MFRASPSRPVDLAIVQFIGEHPRLALAELEAIFDVIHGDGLLEVKGTYAVRATVLPNAPEKTSASAVEREVGGRMKGGRVNLVNPAHVFRVFVGKRAWLTHEVYDRE